MSKGKNKYCLVLAWIATGSWQWQWEGVKVISRCYLPVQLTVIMKELGVTLSAPVFLGSSLIGPFSLTVQ